MFTLAATGKNSCRCPERVVDVDHYGYFGIMHNSHAIERFFVHVFLIWRKWLSRRSQRAHMSSEKMRRLMERYPLPLPRIPRPYRAAQ